MQEDLSCKGFCLSHARGSVSEVGQQDQKKCSSCKGFYVHPMQEVLSHARGSVIWRKGFYVQSHARGSVSCKGFCHLAQEYLSPARGSVYLAQGVLSSGARGSMSNLMQEDLSLE